MKEGGIYLSDVLFQCDHTYLVGVANLEASF